MIDEETIILTKMDKISNGVKLIRLSEAKQTYRDTDLIYPKCMYDPIGVVNEMHGSKYVFNVVTLDGFSLK